MVSDKVFTTDGTSTIYSADFKIISDNHCNVYIDTVLQSRTTYDIINNAAVFNTAPATGKTLIVQVGTTPDDLLTNPTDAGIVATNIADVIIVADDITDVNTVATNITDVNTVAGNTTNVTTVAGNTTNINTVATNDANVTIVADNIADVSTVADDIAKVIKVANDLSEAISEVETVANDLNEATSEIDTVSNSIANVDLVGGSIANVNTVAGINTNVTTVADISTNVTTVAGISANVTTVAGISADVTSVAVNMAEVLTADTNAAAAAASALAAQSSEDDAAIDLGLTNADVVLTHADVVLTHADVILAEADKVQTGLDRIAVAADLVATNQDTLDTAADRVQTSADRIAAAASAASAAAVYDGFDDRYLGSKATEPALDNDGDALAIGALYFDSTNQVMKVNTASGWVATSSASLATMEKYNFTATAGQTLFNGTDDSSKTLVITAGAEMVTLNGIVIEVGEDYTVTTSSVTLTVAANVNDELNVYAFGNFELANHYSKVASDARFAQLTGADFTGDITTTGTVTSTDFIGPLNGAVQFTAKNTSGGTITKGQAIYITGISGNTPEVDLADANNASAMPAFGLAASTAADNDTLEVTTFGSLKGIQTDYSGWVLGDTLYISNTAGTLTNVPPTGEASKIQNIGTVERLHSSNGTIKVGGAGRTNATPNLDAGKIFYGNASNQAESVLLSSVLPAGVPSGIISMWSGAAAAIPSGWNLCDGTNSTPNLVGKFIKGSGTAGTTGGSNTHTHAQTLSAGAHTLSTAEMPSHSHSIQGYANGYFQNYGYQGAFAGSSAYPNAGTVNSGATGGGGSHSHSLSGSITDASTEPAYYTLCYIMKA